MTRIDDNAPGRQENLPKEDGCVAVTNLLTADPAPKPE